MGNENYDISIESKIEFERGRSDSCKISAPKQYEAPKKRINDDETDFDDRCESESEISVDIPKDDKLVRQKDVNLDRARDK